MPAPDPALLARLAKALPAAALLGGDAAPARYRKDRRDRYSAPPVFVARPGTTAEVAATLAACDAFGQPLVVQGGAPACRAPTAFRAMRPFCRWSG